MEKQTYEDTLQCISDHYEVKFEKLASEYNELANDYNRLIDKNNELWNQLADYSMEKREQRRKEAEQYRTKYYG